MDQLAAQALKGTEGEEDLEKQIQEALACPCVGEFRDTSSPVPPSTSPAPAARPAAADLREGPCGPTFVHAFSCYIRSDHQEKGMDCLDEFKSFQECLKHHPGHVEEIMADAEGSAGGEGEAAGDTQEQSRTDPPAPEPSKNA